MMLKDKVAVIYGAGGAIGSAVARAFAAEGANLFLTGHHLAPVEVVAKEVVSAGGSAEAAEVDALDEQAVDKHLRSVIDKAGRVDISFNAIGIPNPKIRVPLVELDVEQFSLPIATYTRSYFVTARLAARRMVANRSGVIMTVTAIPSRTHPIGGRRRSGDGRRGGAHPRSIRRARTSGYSRGRSATPGDAGDRQDQGELRALRQGVGNDLGTVPRVRRSQDSPTTAFDAHGDDERGDLHGFRSGERDDGNGRQLEPGEPG
jgi:NAD(P)-dependent dehydrogenase (short-subunit alcohol dehydrogenase family)